MTDRKKKIILGSAVCLLLVAAGIILYFIKQPTIEQPTTPASEYTMGVLDLKQAMKAHPRYADLEKLRQQRAALVLSGEVKPKGDFSTPVPAADEKVFADAVRQKTEQQLHALAGQQQKQLQDRQQLLRASLEEKRQADMRAISDSYLNAIFNCTLQLDNAASMRLTEAQQKELRETIDGLKQERGSKIQAINQQYEDYIAAEIRRLQQQNNQQMQSFAAKAQEEFQAGEAAKQTAAQQRNAAAMQQGMQNISEDFTAAAKNKADLAAKDKEISVLEELIIKDIAGKAAKSAVRHNLDCIVVNPELNISALDVTDEVIAELKTNKQ